MNFKKISPGYC